MSNVIEKLFDSVLATLPVEPTETAQKPNADRDLSLDVLDEPLDLEGDSVRTLNAHDFLEKNNDILHDEPTPWPLGPEVEDAVEGGIRRSGFDVLAFYKSRRFLDLRPFSGYWGIFYLKHGLDYVQSQIAQAYPGFGSPRSLARQFLRLHERFHFQADLQTLMFEAVRGQHLYQPLRNAFFGRRDEFVEEALANRQVWLWSCRKAIGIEEFAYDFMKLQPGAYARFDEPRLALAAEWAANVVDKAVFPGAGRHDLAQWVETFPQDYLRPSLCPEYVVYPSSINTWLPPSLVLPPVDNIVDGEEVVKRLASKFFANARKPWSNTKLKLKENRYLHGLNLKPWKEDGHDCYSVKVTDAIRAHLRHEGNGCWKAYIIGSHKELGHG
jgi:hypothetical protein